MNMVVADSSPLIVLVNIGHVSILPALFENVFIPPAVADELRASHRPDAVRSFYAFQHPWLQVRRPLVVQQIPRLHPGETEALSLALELGPLFLLVDERAAYREAVARNIPAIGTLLVLEMAAEAKLLNLRESFDKLKQADFWIAHSLLEKRLKLFESKNH